MTVKELIEALGKHPDHLEVFVFDPTEYDWMFTVDQLDYDSHNGLMIVIDRKTTE
jgi:hypothetical protein